MNFRILIFAVVIVAAYYAGMFFSQAAALPSSLENGDGTNQIATANEQQTQNQTAQGSAATVVAPVQTVTIIEATYQQARQALENGEWQQAITDLEQVVAIDESFKNEEVQNALVDAYFKLGIDEISNSESGSGRFEKALSQFRRAMSLAPDNAQVRTETELLNTYLVGQRAVRLGSLQQAIDTLRPLYENSPDYLKQQVGDQLFKAYIEIGDRSMRKGNTQVAIDYFGRAENIEVADKSSLEERLASLELVKLAMSSLTSESTLASTNSISGTSTPVAAIDRSTTPTPSLPTTPPECPDSRAVLTTPQNGAVVNGFVALNGTAVHDEFKYYKIEFTEEFSSSYHFVSSNEAAVTRSTLGVWDSSVVPDGVYKLRVTVVERNGNYPPPCEVTIRVKNG